MLVCVGPSNEFRFAFDLNVLFLDLFFGSKVSFGFAVEQRYVDVLYHFLGFRLLLS